MTAPVPDSAYSWRFYYRPSDAWDAMYRDCEQATVSIEFEQYILENDTVGHRFMEMFIRKAKDGVKVFLICDMFGSAFLLRSPLVRRLRRHGGHLHFYNTLGRLALLMPWKWFPRTHAKTLLIDSRIAYMGGVCIAEYMRHWRDTHIRVTGPVVGQIRQAFDDIEKRILRRRSRGLPRRRQRKPFLYFLNLPSQGHLSIYEELERAVEKAQRYIYITSAFFIPNHKFLELLKRAHARGVDIRVVVPARSDVRLADWICLSYTPRFFASGIRIFHYQETVLHSKTAIIDDDWGTVGSTNFDVISFFHNREANIVMTDAQAIADLKQQFFADLERSLELTPERWQCVPRWKKIAGTAGRALKVFFG